MAKQNKPAIRFKGFTDAWEQRKLSEIAGKVTEKNTGLQYVETLTNSAEFGIISQRDFFDHDISKLGSLDGYYIVRNEDFVYNPRISTSAPVGPINRNKLGRTGVMSPLYTVFRPHDIDTTYLEHFFKCGYWYSFMNFNGDSGARSDRFSIKDDVFFQMPIPVPHIEEQRKIGLFLTQLDHLITLHQRKYDKLQVLKKAMLEKMFPKNGSSVPEIRFKGFTDAWEQRKLGEILQERNTRTSDFESNPLYSLTIESGVTPKTDRYERSSLVTKTEDLFKTVKPNEFVTNPMNLRFGALGYNKNAFTVSVSGYYDVFSIDDDKCSGFWNAYFKTPTAMNIFDNAATGSLIEKRRVKYSTLQQLAFYMPNDLSEKAEIGKYMDTFDHLITLHQRELEKLQNIKKSMLEKMFV